MYFDLVYLQMVKDYLPLFILYHLKVRIQEEEKHTFFIVKILALSGESVC